MHTKQFGVGISHALYLSNNKSLSNFCDFAKAGVFSFNGNIGMLWASMVVSVCVCAVLKTATANNHTKDRHRTRDDRLSKSHWIQFNP